MNMTNFEIKESENSVEIVPLNPNSTPKKARQSQHSWVTPVIVGVIVLAVLFFGIRSRLNAEASLRTVTAQMAVPSISVVQPKPAAPAQEIILPGSMQPFISSPVYARTDGYLKKWYFDIGAHVKAGQLLATIQSPEIDEQLSQARSTLATAQANLNLAEITKTRYEAMFQKHALAQQDRDNAEGTYSANKAMVDARYGERTTLRSTRFFRKGLCTIRWSDHRAQH
jgi:multidrug efflux pump subunit AcrA (membrane-fusion protein)